MQRDARRLLVFNALAALILGLGIFVLVAAFRSGATEPQTQLWLLAWRSKIDGLAEPGLRLRALVILFAGIAAIRLILEGLLSPGRRWSLIIWGTVLALTLASELPAFL
jgi:hypothetical protein